MNQDPQSKFISAGIVGSLVAFVSLVVMAFLPRPFSPMDHFSILSGLKTLSGPEFATYKRYVASNLTWDSLYLFGHVFMWLGYGVYIGKRHTLPAILVVSLGLFSAGLDFIENEMRWSAITSLGSGGKICISYAMFWKTLFGLSFWALFISAFICGVATFGKSALQKLPGLIAIPGLFVAILSYQFGFLPAFLWIMLWHIMSGIFLWRSRCTHT